MQVPDGRSEWKNGRTLLIASFLGISLQNIVTYSLGVFMLPLEAEFHWSRAQISAGLTIFALLVVPMGPYIGSLIDRKGSRALGLPGVLLFSAAFASMSFNNGSLVLWFALWCLIGSSALLIKTTVWTAAVSTMFESRRGMALAITLCGTGLASSGAPIASRYLIDEFGWRTAFVIMGFGWSAIVLPFVFFFFFDARDRAKRGLGGNGVPDPSRFGGLTLGEALRSRAFQLIVISTVLLNLILAGLAVHINPILISQGLTPHQAAAVLGIFGVGAAVGKLSAGWLLDRIHGQRVAPIILGIPAIACLLLILPMTVPMALVAVFLIAFASGAELQTLTYLITRYVGLRQLGKIYGFFASSVACCLGIGPVLAGLTYDVFGNYRPMMLALIPVTLFCALLTAMLGPYPTFRNKGDEADTTDAAKAVESWA